MRTLFFTFIISGTLIGLSQAIAQLDPSSALLLNEMNHDSVRDSGLDSGRYTVKPKANESSSHERVRRPVATVPASEDDEDDRPSPIVKEIGAAMPMPTAAQGVQAPPPIPQPIVVDKPVKPVESPVRVAETEHEPSLNQLELSVAPMYYYNSSDSPFWYRNYNASGPGFSTQARYWISPDFSINASYMSTLGGTIYDSVDHSKNVAITQTWLDAGLRWRKFFGSANHSPHLTFGVDYHEYQFQVAAEANLRQRLKTSGALVSLELEYPRGTQATANFGFSLLPMAQHTESGTGTSVQSGSAVSSYVVSVWAGGTRTLDSSNQIFWKLSETVERDVFNGGASAPDPISGTTPYGVPVTNAFTIFQLGYTWGN